MGLTDGLIAPADNTKTVFLSELDKPFPPIQYLKKSGSAHFVKDFFVLGRDLQADRDLPSFRLAFELLTGLCKHFLKGIKAGALEKSFAVEINHLRRMFVELRKEGIEKPVVAVVVEGKRRLVGVRNP